VGFSLLSDSLPFCSFLHCFPHCLIPIIFISSSMPSIQLFFGLPLILIHCTYNSVSTL
jgi:hypothetical protein